MKHRLSTAFGEDWKAIPKTEIKTEEDEDVKPNVHLLPQIKIKEEKPDECKQNSKYNFIHIVLIYTSCRC